MSELSCVRRVTVPRSVLLEGFAFMRAAGKLRLEGIVLWVGRQAGTEFQVTDCIVPKQHGLDTPEGLCAIVGPEELHRINVHLYRAGLELIAQLHTHPTRAYHSATDDANAIATTEGSYSIVVPNFAVHDYTLQECAVYRLDAAGRWIEVDESCAPNEIAVVEG